MRTILLYTSLLLPVVAVGQKANVVSSASEWTTLKITAADTLVTAGLAKTKPVKTLKVAKPKSAPVAAPVVVTETKPADIPAETKPSKKKAPPSETPVPPARPTVAATAKPAMKSFLETFADNRNGWLTGRRNGYSLEIAKDSYYMRREKEVPRPGRSYIKLPDELNLNKADTFTVSVEMVIPEGIEPDGGLLIGVKDTSNYCQFRLLSTSKVALYTRVNGVAQANYMTGKPTAAKVPISGLRNTLTIRRTGDQLHFYINGKEVEDSPHPYRPFKGNGVGFISFTNATKFQYLTVQMGK